MVERIGIQCGACKQPLFIDAPEPAKIANLDAASVIVIEHPTQYECPSCHVRLVLAVMPGPVALVGRPIKPKEAKSSIILM